MRAQVRLERLDGLVGAPLFEVDLRQQLRNRAVGVLPLGHLEVGLGLLILVQPEVRQSAQDQQLGSKADVVDRQRIKQVGDLVQSFLDFGCLAGVLGQHGAQVGGPRVLGVGASRDQHVGGGLFAAVEVDVQASASDQGVDVVRLQAQGAGVERDRGFQVPGDVGHRGLLVGRAG